MESPLLGLHSREEGCNMTRPSSRFTLSSIEEKAECSQYNRDKLVSKLFNHFRGIDETASLSQLLR
jgi:hypothetical protein